jgi:transcriptional regulator with XRE-family HTH domain
MHWSFMLPRLLFKNRWTEAELAKNLGISQTMVSALTRGTRRPSKRVEAAIMALGAQQGITEDTPVTPPTMSEPTRLDCACKDCSTVKHLATELARVTAEATKFENMYISELDAMVSLYNKHYPPEKGHLRRVGTRLLLLTPKQKTKEGGAG